MRKIREVLRLAWGAGLRRRQIARSLLISPVTVGEYLRRARAAGLCWPLPGELDEVELEARLFPAPLKGRIEERALPDFAEVHRELKRKGVTLLLLWQEYKATHPNGLHYSRFCERYRAWAGQLDWVMRQTHRAGEKLFVDYAGQTVPIVEGTTGDIRPASIFVAVLGASNYTYAEATWTQGLPDWIGSHGRAFEYFGGLPEVVVPDNLKAGVTRAHRYEPDLNPTYQEMACHYGTAIVPARVGRPRDKAKVEAGVLVVERWILARLRHHTFFSLTDLNGEIRRLLEGLNTRPFKKLEGSRKTLFESLDRPALQPLPDKAYQYAEWKKARVHIDYHVEVDGHYYSVPYPLIKQPLEVRMTATTVEFFHRGQRVASHLRSSHKGSHTTLHEHMPKAHQSYARWTPERLVRWAEQTGPATTQVVERILSSRRHPHQGCRSCLGILRLGTDYGADRLEAACRRAVAIQAFSYRSLHSILKQGLDRRPLPDSTPATALIVHPNIRGGHYYH